MLTVLVTPQSRIVSNEWWPKSVPRPTHSVEIITLPTLWWWTCIYYPVCIFKYLTLVLIGKILTSYIFNPSPTHLPYKTHFPRHKHPVIPLTSKFPRIIFSEFTLHWQNFLPNHWKGCIQCWTNFCQHYLNFERTTTII